MNWYSIYRFCQAPIQVFGLEGRYAHAAYSAATKQKQLDKVEQEFTKLKVCFAHVDSSPKMCTSNDSRRCARFACSYSGSV